MRARVGWGLAGVIVLAVAATVAWTVSRQEPPAGGAAAVAAIVPAPAELVATPGVRVTIGAGAPIVVSPDSPAATEVGAYLAELIGGATPTEGTERTAGGVALLVDPAIDGAEAYELAVDAEGVVIRASTGAGLFWGVQTLRQLLPTEGPLELPGLLISDHPRFGYRGAMLDVARHFFGVDDVKRYIDLAALEKINYLHLHLSDDQGWRIAIDGWPRLTDYGSGTEVGGGPGGYYTQEDYREIVAYAASRFMTVVPEIDLPGHTNAALASYPELTCDGVEPPRYTGIEVGFSAICPDGEETDRFLDDVFGQLAALTPGPYLHIGGDEAPRLTEQGYAEVVTRAQAIVESHGKVAIGWHDIANADLGSSTVLQYWGPTGQESQVAADGPSFIMSPANRAYLDQKYDLDTRIGLMWAGPTSVKAAYGWDPAAEVGETAVLGVEAPLWTETVTTVDDIEYLAFPRLAAIAEIGWSPATTHDWAAFRERLGAQAPLWDALGVDFARVEEIPWAG
jgi:hexosaminidase